MERDDDSEWFEVTDDFWLDPHEIRPKLRLLDDRNISSAVVSALRSAKIDITAANDLNVGHLPDEDLLNFAAPKGLVILTTENDFWSDRRFPIGRKGGVDRFGSKAGRCKKVSASIRLAYGAFPQSLGGHAARGLRVKAGVELFVVKSNAAFGGRTIYECALKRGAFWCEKSVLELAAKAFAIRNDPEDQLAATPPHRSATKCAITCFSIGPADRRRLGESVPPVCRCVADRSTIFSRV